MTTKKEPAKKKKKEKVVLTTGHRKRAIARATARRGTGRVFINSKPLQNFSELPRLLMKEPLIIGEDVSKTVDIFIDVRGGGVMGQAEACRTAIAKALVGFNHHLKKKLIEYDRTLLVDDSRRTEPHKPSRSKKGPRRHKQRSKR